MSEAAENKANESPRKSVLRTIPSTSNTLGKPVVLGRGLGENAGMGKQATVSDTHIADHNKIKEELFSGTPGWGSIY